MMADPDNDNLLTLTSNIVSAHLAHNTVSTEDIPALIRKVVERHDPLEVWGDGNDLKEFIYIQDFIDGMLLVMEKIECFDPINIATGQPCTVNDVLSKILKIDNYSNANIVFNTSKPTMIPKRLIDITKAKSQLGFQARVSLEDGLRKTIAWYRTTLTGTGGALGTAAGYNS